MASSSAFCYIGLALFLLTACGNKPDGTPYGVNPNKHPDGHYVRGDSAKGGYGTGTGMPKGAEMNAVTSGAKAGQPAQQMPLDMPQ